jgi:hypothetical protein
VSDAHPIPPSQREVRRPPLPPEQSEPYLFSMSFTMLSGKVGALSDRSFTVSWQPAKNSQHLLGGGDTAGGPFSSASGLSLTRFFLRLLKPMLGMSCQPAMSRVRDEQGQACTVYSSFSVVSSMIQTLLF